MESSEIGRPSQVFEETAKEATIGTISWKRAMFHVEQARSSASGAEGGRLILSGALTFLGKISHTSIPSRSRLLHRHRRKLAFELESSRDRCILRLVGTSRLMPPASTLTPKQRRFVAEYLIDLNATQAARRAGYSSRVAKQQGTENLAKPIIKAALAAGRAQQLQTADLSAARVLEELRRLSMVDMRSFYDAAGNLKPIHALTPEQGSQLASVEVIVKNAEAGDGHTDRVHKIRVWDKPRSLELLAKHFALLVERVHVGVEDANIALLLAGRQRAAQGKAVTR